VTALDVAQPSTEAATAPTTILIVDDHAMVAQAFAIALDREPDLVVVGRATTVAEAGPVIARTRPDVAIVDIRLPDGDGIELVERIAEGPAPTRTLVVTSATDECSLWRALGADVGGYLLKDQPIEQLVAGVRTVAAGRVAYAPSVVQRVARASLSGHSRLEEPSRREVEVLQELALGRSTADVAAVLGIAGNTVRNHVQSVLIKLGAHSRVEAVATGIRMGLVQPPPQDPVGPR
jgi:DNA-binding NarL/FixJ family response regulator